MESLKTLSGRDPLNTIMVCICYTTIACYTPVNMSCLTQWLFYKLLLMTDPIFVLKWISFTLPCTNNWWKIINIKMEQFIICRHVKGLKWTFPYSLYWNKLSCGANNCVYLYMYMQALLIQSVEENIFPFYIPFHLSITLIVNTVKKWVFPWALYPLHTGERSSSQSGDTLQTGGRGYVP